jgi:hypothetical protein
MSRPLIRVLLLCGLLSSLLYAVVDIVGILSYPGYDVSAQAISEMSAVGAPTRGLLAPFYAAFSLLFVAFAAGVWLAGRERRLLRWAASFLLGVTLVGAGLSFFPMTMRGLDRTPSDATHLLFAAATMILLAGAMVSGAGAFGRRFRLYSAASVAFMLLFFVITMLDVPNVAANRPTPFMGLNERLCMAVWLAWMAVFSLRLLRDTGAPIRDA